MENLSLFDEQQTMENLDGVKDSNHLDVVKLKYESCESLTWQELFSGFNDLYAITYSSGIGFVCKLLDHFEQAEIIFGCEDVMDCYNAGATYEADRILKELPETLEVRKSRDCLMMNLEEAQKFFGITFKKPLIPWFSKFFS